MILHLKKFSTVAICTTAISLFGIKANLAQTLTYDLDNNSFVGVLEVAESTFNDLVFNEQDLERLVIKNFTLEGTLFTPDTPLIFDVFTGSDFNISVFDLLVDEIDISILNHINKIIGQTTDGTSSFSFLAGDVASNGEGVDFEFTSPILAGTPFDGGVSLSLTKAQIEQRDIPPLELLVEPAPEPEPQTASTPEPGLTFLAGSPALSIPPNPTSERGGERRDESQGQDSDTFIS